MRWFFVDEIIECVPGESIVAAKSFSRSDDFFQDHFPHMPIVPGVLQIEMIAAACGRAIRLKHPDVLTLLGGVKSAKFYESIRPGARCSIHGKILSLTGNSAVAEGRIDVGGRRVTQATVLFGLRSIAVLGGAPTDPVIEQWQAEQQVARRGA